MSNLQNSKSSTDRNSVNARDASYKKMRHYRSKHNLAQGGRGKGSDRGSSNKHSDRG